MPPKDDPETAKLKQELQALIEQCKVHHTNYVRIIFDYRKTFLDVIILFIFF